MNLLKFISNGRAAQIAVDDTIAKHKPADAPTHELRREVAARTDGKLMMERIDKLNFAMLEGLATISLQKEKFPLMTDLERGLLAESVEQVGKCCYALGASLRGIKTKEDK